MASTCSTMEEKTVSSSMSRKRDRGLSPNSKQETASPKKKSKIERKKKKHDNSPDVYKETTGYVMNGLRYVRPYYFTFTTHAKGRWVGSKVVDVFSKEFQSETPQYYERAIKAGKVTVNGVEADMDTVVRENEVITHRVHRHEPPVTAQPIHIIHQDQEIIVIDKPASIPVHPCGRYRHNSVVFLLAKEHNLQNLHTVHRLDRLTSGLLMFARSVAKAQAMEAEIRERKVSKVYLCRVKGEFPNDVVECSEPILVVTHKVGVCRVDPAGKPCSTTFTRISFNGSTSLVKCEPKTGRMHQIRVHLQWLGYPIVNDPIYNHPAWKSPPDDNEKQSNIERIISEIVKSNYSESTKEVPSTPSGLAIEAHELQTSSEVKDGPSQCTIDDQTTSFRNKPASKCETSEQSSSSSDAAPGVEVDPFCTECHVTRPDPTHQQLVMYLHALSYKGPCWEYSTALPDWAHSDWKEFKDK